MQIEANANLRRPGPGRTGRAAASMLLGLAVGMAVNAAAQEAATGITEAAMSSVSNASAAVAAPYDLRRCLETALNNSFEIRKARERIRRQSGAVVEARARLLPRLAANADYLDQDETTAGNFSGPQGGDFAVNTESWQVGLDVVQPLYAGGASRAALKRQHLLATAAAHDMAAVINNVLLDVRERYYGVLLAQSQINVQEQYVTLLEEELTSATNKLQAGTVSPFNVLRAEVALANGQTPLIRARNSYRIGIEDLCRAMGLERTESGAGEAPPVEVAGVLTVEAHAPDLTAELAAALAGRPELKRLTCVRQAQAMGLSEARAGRRPDLSVFAGYGWERDRASDNTWDAVEGWRAGVKGSWDIFDGLQTRGRLIQAGSDVTLADLDMEQARLDIAIDVRRSHAQFVDATELVRATGKVVEQAVESLRLARSRFDSGAATQLDVLQTQVALTEARDNEVQARHAYLVALARLQKATGTLDAVVVTSAEVVTTEE